MYDNLYIFYSQYTRCRVSISQYIIENYNPIIINTTFDWGNIKKYKDLEFKSIDDLSENRIYLYRGILNQENLEKLKNSNKTIFIVALNNDPIMISTYFKNKALAIYDGKDVFSSKFLIGKAYEEIDSISYFKLLKRKLILKKIK